MKSERDANNNIAGLLSRGTSTSFMDRPEWLNGNFSCSGCPTGGVSDYSNTNIRWRTDSSPGNNWTGQPVHKETRRFHREEKGIEFGALARKFCRGSFSFQHYLKEKQIETRTNGYWKHW